jgi:glutamate/tyrosine decarboxylase-like PLP-dependent enzyme
VLFHDPAVGRLYQHESPYTYFTSGDLHLGEISLECSRAGAAAVALWATQRLLPLVPDGEFARGLAKGRRAALELDRRIREDQRFVTLSASLPGSQNRDPCHPPQLDIVVWALRAADSRTESEHARRVFDACAARGLHLALAQLPGRWFGAGGSAKREEGMVTCLRSVLMKPEHEAWMGEIWQRLEAACEEVLKG